MVKREWFLLLKLAELGALKHPIFTSTTQLSKDFNCSQQTVSRLLQKLHLKGYIERRMGYRGEYINMSKAGQDELRNMYTTLESVFTKTVSPLTIRGKLFTGFAEGAYYIMKDGYLRQFINKLGFKPYPGTFNLKLTTPTDLAARRELENMPGIIIEEFSNGQRAYGTIKCLPVLINDKVEGAALFIQRTHYNSSVLEIIAPVYLRDILKVKDDEQVTIRYKF